jgi:MOSC domain-containing protein YiiM
VHAIGSARLAHLQPRQPCFKFALRFGDPRLPNAMIRNERSGWYYRVLEEGEVRAGDAVTLVAREAPGFAFARLVTIVYRRTATPEEWAALAASPGLASDLREAARRRIA